MPHPFEHRVDPRRALENVRTKSCERARVQLEHGAVPEHGFDVVTLEHEPRLPCASLAARANRPATGHAQVRTQDDAALEAQDEVLALRGDRLEDAPVDPLGDALGLRAPMR